MCAYARVGVCGYVLVYVHVHVHGYGYVYVLQFLHHLLTVTLAGSDADRMYYGLQAVAVRGVHGHQLAVESTTGWEDLGSIIVLEHIHTYPSVCASVVIFFLTGTLLKMESKPFVCVLFVCCVWPRGVASVSLKTQMPSWQAEQLLGNSSIGIERPPYFTSSLQYSCGYFPKF
jgi:hypothetical protein